MALLTIKAVNYGCNYRVLETTFIILETHITISRTANLMMYIRNATPTIYLRYRHRPGALTAIETIKYSSTEASFRRQSPEDAGCGVKIEHAEARED